MFLKLDSLLPASRPGHTPQGTDGSIESTEVNQKGKK